MSRKDLYKEVEDIHLTHSSSVGRVNGFFNEKCITLISMESLNTDFEILKVFDLNGEKIHELIVSIDSLRCLVPLLVIGYGGNYTNKFKKEHSEND